MNLVEFIRISLPYNDHGIIQGDTTRDDRQNYRSAEKIVMNSVLSCCRAMIEGGPDVPPHPELKGLYSYLKLINLYITMFQSRHTTLAEKVKMASTVIRFLELWYHHIRLTPGLRKDKHFITNQCFLDVTMSCHAAVSIIVYMRDNFPHLQCCLNLTGTDCVETFWSKMGQWVGNHHNYTYGDLRRNYAHMIRLEEIRLNPNAPEYAKPHPKQETRWNTQYQGPEVDLSVYPTDEEILSQWRQGITDAEAMAVYVGIRPDIQAVVPNDGDDDVDDEDRGARNEVIEEELVIIQGDAGMDKYYFMKVINFEKNIWENGIPLPVSYKPIIDLRNGVAQTWHQAISWFN